MQIICNFGFWKIGLFKKYYRTTFLFKLQNGCIIQNGADHYDFRSWTITFVFFNRFYKLSIFACFMIFIIKMADIFKLAFFRFFMLFFKLWKLLKLLFQNMISMSKSWKQNFNKKTRWRINLRWRVVLKFCS
jgi:hypothetical protein